MPLPAHVAKNHKYIMSSLDHGVWEAKDAVDLIGGMTARK
jgi:hypothetical protein